MMWVHSSLTLNRFNWMHLNNKLINRLYAEVGFTCHFIKCTCIINRSRCFQKIRSSQPCTKNLLTRVTCIISLQLLLPLPVSYFILNRFNNACILCQGEIIPYYGRLHHLFIILLKNFQWFKIVESVFVLKKFLT